MTEQRKNWKAGISKAAREREQRFQCLMNELIRNRDAIRDAGINWTLYDQLKEEQREIIAALAAL